MVFDEKYPNKKLEELDDRNLSILAYQAIRIVQTAANLSVKKFAKTVLEAKIKQIQITNVLKTE